MPGSGPRQKNNGPATFKFLKTQKPFILQSRKHSRFGAKPVNCNTGWGETPSNPDLILTECLKKTVKISVFCPFKQSQPVTCKIFTYVDGQWTMYSGQCSGRGTPCLSRKTVILVNQALTKARPVTIRHKPVMLQDHWGLGKFFLHNFACLTSNSMADFCRMT